MRTVIFIGLMTIAAAIDGGKENISNESMLYFSIFFSIIMIMDVIDFLRGKTKR